MVEFNHAIWNNWILEGYRFISYKDMDTYIILKPVRDESVDQAAHDLDAEIYGIREDEIYLFADNKENVPVYCEGLDLT